MTVPGTFECHSIIEALRTGVPSELVVRRFAPDAPHIAKRYSELLRAVAAGNESAPAGVVFGGAFGTGKSHILEKLALDALEGNYVISRAKVSRERPLSRDLEFLFQLMQETRAKGFDDDAFAQIVMQAVEGGQLGSMVTWTENQVSTGALSPGYSVMLKALVGLGRRGEHAESILDYWAGASIPAASLRAAVRASGHRSSDSLLVRASDRPLQTMRFIARLYQHLGYRGWIILLDEVELIRMLGPVARARSYAALARRLGLEPGWRVNGLGTVAAITDTYGRDWVDASNPLGQQDEAHLPPRLLVAEANRELVVPCKRGLAAIKSIELTVPKPTAAQLQALQQDLQHVYQSAYGREVQPVVVVVDPNKSMRAYIRSWITAWDLQRQGRGSDVVIDDVAPNPDTDGLDDD